MRASSALSLLSKYGNLLALAVFVIIASVLSPHFLTLENVFNIFRQVTVLGIVAVGMTYVILNKSIDLSVGSVLALCGVTAGLLHDKGFLISLVAALGVGAACGTVNGLLVTRAKMQPFIATLVMFIIARGAAMWMTGGKYIANVTGWKWLSSGTVARVPLALILLVTLYAVLIFVLNRTVWGRQVVAVGGNEEAARLSGIHVNRIKLSVFVLTGLLVGLAAMVNVGRIWSADPSAGHLLELDAISAVLIGGTTFEGGTGSLGGTFIGILILQIMSNILNLLGVSVYPQMIAKGVIIATAVLISQIRRKK